MKPTGVFPMEGIDGMVGYTSRKKLEQARAISEEAFSEKAKELGFKLKKSVMAVKAESRPVNYAQLSASEQWAIDKELGILDWDGN